MNKSDRKESRAQKATGRTISKVEKIAERGAKKASRAKTVAKGLKAVEKAGEKADKKLAGRNARGYKKQMR